MDKGIIILQTRFFSYICYPMTIQNKIIFASILFVLISFVCVAQDPGSIPPPPGPPPPPGFPIDGGLLFGMIFALFYGVKKLVFPTNNN